MKLFENENPNKLSKLESEIFRASENELTADELRNLEKKLEQHPELMKVYNDITNLPDLSKVYSKSSFISPKMEGRIDHMMSMIENEESPSTTFANLSILLFKRYALAASVLFLALTSGFYFIQNSLTDGEFSVEELLYPIVESETETYVYYLEQLFEQ